MIFFFFFISSVSLRKMYIVCEVWVIKIRGFLSICIVCELSVIKWLLSLWIKFVEF